MSYCTFEINNGELTIRPAMYKGIASTKGANNIKSFDDPRIQDGLPESELHHDDMFGCDDEPEYGSDLIDIGLDD